VVSYPAGGDTDRRFLMAAYNTVKERIRGLKNRDN